MIAITGASGKLGHHVVQELIKRIPANQIIVVVRNPQKSQDLKDLGIELRQGDYEQPESLVKALNKVDKVLLISSNEIGKREAQHKAVIEGAVKNNVKHIVYTSILKADSSQMFLAGEHLATEKNIKATGIDYTFLRNGWYLENHTENLAGAIESGYVIGAAGEGLFSSASRRDYAMAAVEVLTKDGHQNKIYELAGSESFSLKDLANELSLQLDKKINYKDMPEGEYEKILERFGLPQNFANMLADSDTGAKNGFLQSSSKDLEKLIGQKTTALSEAIKLAIK